MEQQNQEGDKTKTLKINEYLTEEKLRNKLKKIKQLEKIQIYVEFCENFTQYFEIIKDFLNERKDFHSLEINFNRIYNLVIEDSLHLFQDISQITNLSLSFRSMIYLSKTQKYTLSTCLLSFQNLEFLQLSLEFSQIFLIDNQLSLTEFYQKTLNLRSLDISISYLQNETYYLNLLLDGISYLKELKSFSFQIFYSKQQASYILDILEKELNQNINLTELKIDLGYKIFTSESCFQQIQRILKNQNNLLNLDLSINYYYQCQLKNQQSQLSKTDIYNEFLPNLKKFNLKLYYITVPFGIFILNALSKISKVDQINLDFTIQKNKSFILEGGKINNIQDLAESICKFINLESLAFIFPFSWDLKFYDLINFISQFNSLEKLKKLKIEISSMKDFSENKMLNEQQFYEVIKQLNVIDIKIRFDCSQFTNSYYANILTKSICNSEKVEELYLDIYDYSTNFKTQQLQLQDFGQNKYNLKQLELNLGKFLEIEDSQVLQLFSRLKQNKDLKKLLLNFKSKTCLSRKALEELSDNLIELKKLGELEIEIQNGSVTVSDSGFQKLINTFKNLNSLTDFSIQIAKDQFTKNTGSDFINDEQEADFGNSFKFPKKLDYIDIFIDINQVKWKNFENMFQQISELKKLTALFFQFKSLLIQKHESILLKQYLSQLKHLEQIYWIGYCFSLLHLLLLFQEIQSLSTIQLENSVHDGMYCRVYAEREFLIDEYHALNNLTNFKSLLSKSLCHPQKVSLEIKNNQFMSNYEVQNSYDQNLIPFIFESLMFLTTLEFEISENNQLGEKNTQLIFKNLSCLQFLKILKIETKQNNQIGDESILLFGQSLLQLQNLEDLKFVLYENGNNLDWLNLFFFLQCLGELKQLNGLSIKFVFEVNSQDLIKKEKFSNEICRYVANLNKLKDLSITLKNLSIQSDFLCEFNHLCLNLSKNLRNLTLYFDQKQDQAIKQISKSLLLLQNLQNITISQKNNLIKKLKRLAQINHTYEYFYD
ncbi:hypothetical protein ABPG74_009840 [Tetrahymena malaccensis]